MTNDESMTNDEKAVGAARRIIVRASSFAVEIPPQLRIKLWLGMLLRPE